MNKNKAWQGAIQVRPTEADEALTEQEVMFVEAYVSNGGNGSQAVKDAGYEQVPTYMQNVLLKKPAVRAAIEAKRDLVIKTNGATVAWAVMNRLMVDPNTPHQVQFQAARWTLEASGHGLSAIAASLQMGLRERNKSIGELPVSELMEIVERGAEKFNNLNGAVKRAIKAHENTINLPNDDKGRKAAETDQGPPAGGDGSTGQAQGG